MTILTSVGGEKKSDLPPAPEVFNGFAFLVENEKNDAEVAKCISGRQPVVVTMKPRPLIVRRQQRCIWCALCGLFIIVVLILGSICLYKNLMARQIEAQTFYCGVRYHEMGEYYSNRLIGDNDGGEFEETVEIDEDYEKISVPMIGDTSRSTILHDFSVNYTAIVDKEKRNCFLMPLNRSLVLPPHDFGDLLMKLKTGYYIPDTYIVRESFRVVTPALNVVDLDNYGIYISIECRTFSTYKLIRNVQPNDVRKRDACEFMGDSYCLGDAGVERMLCFQISGCI